MRIVSRRSVLKNVAKISSLMAAAPLISMVQGCAPRDRQIRLNVALHGLFLLNIIDTGIELLTPRVIPDHKYKAGNWDTESICHLHDGMEYALRGVRPEGQFPVFDETLMPCFSKSGYNVQIQREASFCSIFLPFPSDFKPLRQCTAPPDALPFASDQYSNEVCDPVNPIDICITSLALCPVLTYVVPDYRDLALTHTSWRSDIDHDTGTANLHLWAEPEKRLMPNHADRAYASLSCLVPPLRLHLAVYSTVPLDIDTGVVGFPPEQEQGWSDWAGDGGEGAYPTNCCAMLGKK